MSTKLFEDDTLQGPTVTDGTACGPNMEYAPRYLEFLALAQSKPEQQLGNSILPSQDPDWREVLDAGKRLLAESRDLRIVAIVTHAATQVHGIAGLQQALELVAQWLERFWDDLHPQIEIDGERDPLMRANAIGALSDPTGVVRALRNAILLDCPTGSVRVADADAALQGKSVDPAAIATTADQLSRVVAAEYARNRERLDALARAHRSLVSVETLWRARLETDYWPELGLLRELLHRLEAATRQNGPQDEPGRALIESNTDGAIAPGTTYPTANPLPDRVVSRDDAFRALALARAYFERQEPSHPAPLLIRRIERLVSLDFARIIEELTPEGLNQLRQLAGSEATPN